MHKLFYNKFDSPAIAIVSNFDMKYNRFFNLIEISQLHIDLSLNKIIATGNQIFVLNITDFREIYVIKTITKNENGHNG
jgi:hypothetical protein